MFRYMYVLVFAGAARLTPIRTRHCREFGEHAEAARKLKRGRIASMEIKAHPDFCTKHFVLGFFSILKRSIESKYVLDNRDEGSTSEVDDLDGEWRRYHSQPSQ